MHRILQIRNPATITCAQTNKQAKKLLAGCSNEEVITETEAYFEELDKSFYKNIELLEWRCK